MLANQIFDEDKLWPFPFRAAIFDFDGTIAATDDIWTEIDRKFLADRKIEWTPDLGSKLAALGFNASAAYVIERFDLDESVEEVCTQWDELARKAYAEDVVLRPGVEAILEIWHAAGIKLGLATSNTHEVLDALAPRIVLDQLFDEVVCTQDVGTTKHEPDVYLEVARRLKVGPQECLVFEDIPQALRTVRKAKMASCGVTTGHITQDEKLIRQEADFIIDGWERLAELTQG